ncbi:MAG: stress response translation initiation inhibitor YciH [Anaerolineales bacterium]|nr:stress response translation initiation inhibitor YciH [Anaerolineales bacterium]
MSKTKTVWSSEHGDLRKKDLTASTGSARRPNPSPAGSPKGALREGESVPPHQQTVYLHCESAGRGGKAVTLVKNLALSAEKMKLLAKKLKQECGTGGTVKDGVIEIQGEHREKIAGLLSKAGYKVKIAGG